MAAIKRVIVSSVPGTLAEGTEVFVEDGSGGLDLYIGNSSNNPVLVSANQFLQSGAVVEVSDIVDNLTSADADKPLSANQGKVLNENKQPGIIDTITPDSSYFSAKSIGTVFHDKPRWIILGKKNSGQRLSGTIYSGSNGNFNDGELIDVIFHSTSFPENAINVTFKKVNNITSVSIVECTYNSETHVAIEISGTSSGRYSRYYYYEGWVSANSSSDQNTYPVVVGENEISNVISYSTNRTSVTYMFTDSVVCSGEITADDFITVSRVESDRENALQALDNISQWKKKDGSIDYEKHYAYRAREVEDEEGKVIRIEPGLSMEKRVAMLEKMMFELREENRNLKTQLEKKK